MTRAAAPSVHAALADLIDYAGLFPPALLGMRDAIREYDDARHGPHAWMLGKFIVPLSRLPELLESIGDRDPFEVSVIIDPPSDARSWFDHVRTKSAVLQTTRARDSSVVVSAAELLLPKLGSRRETYDAAIGQGATMLDNAGLRDLPNYFEIPRDERWAELLPGTLASLSRARLRAKVRCGGVVQDAFPTPAELANFIAAAANEHVRFKATAGLHHPVRHRDPATGFMMHGFLNVLFAAVFAEMGATADELEAVLAEERAAALCLDDEGLIGNGRRATTSEIERARAKTFIAYGSCSFDEPVADLVALGSIA